MSFVKSKKVMTELAKTARLLDGDIERGLNGCGV